MAGKTSGLLEESGGFIPATFVASKSARNSRHRQGSECGRTGARSTSKSNNNNNSNSNSHYNDADDTTNKTAGYYCGQPGSCKSPATIITKPASEPTNNGGRAGNNSNRVGSAIGNRSSYSKIFRQYLPSSLNLNYSSSGGKRAGGKADARVKANVDEEQGEEEEEEEEEEKEELREKEKRQQQKQRVITRVQQVEGGQSKQLVTKSIASALSRFRISSNSVKDKQARDFLLDYQVDQSKSSQKTVADSSSIVTTQHTFGTKQRRSSIQQVHDINNNYNSNSNNNNNNGNSYCEELLGRQVKVQFDLSETGEDRKNEVWRQERSVTRQPVEKEQRVKRKGFLYLKKINKKGEDIKPIAGESSNQKSQIATEEGRGRANLLSSNHYKKSNQKDPNNNNSISSLLSSPSNGHHVDDHTTCLLDEQEEEEEEEQEEGNEEDMFVEKSKQKVTLKQILATDQSRGAKKMYTNYSSKSKPSRTSKQSDHLLAAGSLLAALLIVLTALLTTSVALAQQQLPSGSFRSQPSLQGGPQSQQSNGGPQSSLVGAQPPLGGGGSNRSPASQSAAAPPPQPVAGSLVANINCNKIRGHVTLTPNLRGGTTVTTQISAGPPGEVYQWSVHQFPVKPGAAMCSCSALILGTKLIDLSEMHGNLPSDQEFNVQSSLNLFGADSPVGHSLMLRGMKTGMVACATFLPTSRKSNYRAKFHTPLSGSVTIFQTAFGTSFISHLMYSNGTRRHSMHRFDLLKSEEDIETTSLLNGGQSAASLAPSSNSRHESQLALEMREHENELSQCRRFINGEPLFKNISHQLSVSTENFGMRGRTSLVLPQIPFETFSSVYLVVYSEYDASEPIACAPLKFVKPKTAAAKFQSVSVQGSVVFSQDSPYDVTVARINLNLPNSDGHSYGIDELPMIIRRKSDTRVCPNIREIIYNPHHVEPSSVPPEGEATSDQYAVGDLSGKYGSLTGKANEKIQVNDFNLPLFGPISIVGRAMTIYSAEGVAIACSNVELTTPMTTAFATFDYGIQGQFIFRQPVNDCNGDTYVYIEVSKPVQSGSTTSASSHHSVASNSMTDSSSHHDHNMRSLDHNWHIHVNPVDSGLDHLSTTDCSPAGPHFNPYNTSTTSIYSRDCTPFNVLRCELGDLSAKMFTIDIPPYRVKGGQEPDIGKFFGTDIDLPLCGPVSVVNRSVVVHVQDFGVQRLACSTVIEFKPRTS